MPGCSFRFDRVFVFADQMSLCVNGHASVRVSDHDVHVLYHVVVHAFYHVIVPASDRAIVHVIDRGARAFYPAGRASSCWYCWLSRWRFARHFVMNLRRKPRELCDLCDCLWNLPYCFLYG